jgi:16S rRNA G966 N2-methylase RsmD
MSTQKNISTSLTNCDQQFYPTPKNLAFTCFNMLENNYNADSFVLDPSAGKGDFLNHFVSYIKSKQGGYYRVNNSKFSAIEIDANLRKILINDDIKIIGDDFLTFESIETFDLIIMNPPFKNGDKHLLKALNFVINGEIICILNAETIRNPFSNTRKELVQKLNELNAKIKYVDNAFSNDEVERTAQVDVALIHIKITQDFDKIFGNEHEKTELDLDLKDGTEVKDNNQEKSIDDLIFEYKDYQKRIVEACTSIFKSSYGCREFFQLAVLDPFSTYSSQPNVYSMSQIELAIRDANNKLKKRFWHIILDRPEFKSKLTSNEVRSFNNIIKQFSDMEFSINNINLLYEYLLNNVNELFKNAIFKLFDEITERHSFYPETEKNVYLFNGWKSNNGYKINNRFILRFHNAYNHYLANFETKSKLDDIEKVFSYFNNGIAPDQPISKSYNDWYHNKIGNIFENSMFKCRIFKKGTIHFHVKDDALLRRFNVYVGRARAWLPPDYACKKYKNCSTEEQEVIKSFESQNEYIKHINDTLLTSEDSHLLMITA